VRFVFFMTLVLALLGAGNPTRAADRVTLQLKWVPQAQFAGYYVAAQHGYYRELGLEVTIKPGGPRITPADVLARGEAEVTVDWLPSALAARERGTPLVNIAQIFVRSGLELTCLKSSGVRTARDFRGHVIGVWYAGNEYPFLSWMARLGIPTDGGPRGIKILRQGYDVAPLLRKEAACISTMSYNEYGQVLDAGLKPSQLVVFKYSDYGVATLEDGLYALEARLKDPAFVDRMARLVAATDRGWRWAAKHPEEAVRLVLAQGAGGPDAEHHQRFMMREVAKLLPKPPAPIGYLNLKDYNRTVNELLTGGDGSVITKPPRGAWTHAVWQAAQPYAKRLSP
jgi:NitT/TauT family transport system substrate-binding protein